MLGTSSHVGHTEDDRVLAFKSARRMPPVLLSLRKNTTFHTDDSDVLCFELISRFEGSRMVSSVITDNVPDQSYEFDQISRNTSPMLHVRCTADMLNLVVVNTLHNKHFVAIMESLAYIQSTFWVGSVAACIGQKDPRFIRTR
jgi:hypothetical protein